MKQTIYYLLVKVVKKKLMYSKYTNMQKVEVRAGKAMELKGKPGPGQSVSRGLAEVESRLQLA